MRRTRSLVSSAPGTPASPPLPTAARGPLARRAAVSVAGVTLTVAALAGCGGTETEVSATVAADSTGAADTSAQDAAAAASGSSSDSTSDESTGDAAADGSSADATEKATEAAAAAVADTGSEVAITLADGSSSADGANVTITGDVVTITASGTYRLTGTLTAGQIVVDAVDDGLVRLVLDGVSVSSPSGPALLVEQAADAAVYLESGSENTLVDHAQAAAANADDDAPNAAPYSRDDLTIAGDGSLVVEGNVADGITSKDDLTIASGTIVVSAVDDGLRGKDSLTVLDGAVTVTVGGDALSADDTTTGDDGTETGAGDIVVNGGVLDLTAGTDALDATDEITVTGGSLTIDAYDDALHADAKLVISGGTIDVLASYEGLESAIIEISGGTISVVSSDDGLNVSAGNDGSGQQGPGGGGRGGGDMFSVAEGAYALISGGTLVIDSDGDGLDSNGTLEITGGTIVVNGPTAQNNGALDVNGSFEISGGTLLAIGSAGMAESPDTSSAQASIAVRFRSAQSAGTVVQIVSADGDVVAAFEAAQSFESVVFSSDELQSGASYSIVIGGDVAGTTLGGLLVDGSATGGESAGEVTAS